MNDAAQDEVTAAEGLLWRGGKVIPVQEADSIAVARGYHCAEQLVRALEAGKKTADESRRRTALRLLLWPILWWFALEAAYCADAPPPAADVQLAPPPPLRIDLSGVSESAIERTVIHLRQLVRDADTHAAEIGRALAIEHAAHVAAQAETDAVQTKLDEANNRAAAAEAEAKSERTWKWRWFFAWLVTLALVAAFFVARQYVPSLKAI